MSVSKTWVQNENNQREVLNRYRSPELPRLVDIAKELGTTFHNAQAVVRLCLPEAERKALAALRYSVSKVGSKNPMHGKKGEAHHNWKGLCEDGYGYLTCLWNEKRYFVHRVVMMEALGLESIPEGMDVHHIDGNPKNNTLDNLALVTKRGHREIHSLQAQDSLSLALRKSTLREALKSMTSP
jgi:hypothetical protein